MKKFTLVLGAAIALAATTLTACGGGNTTAATLVGQIESGSITLGTKFDQPGLGLRTPDGTMSGLDVDVAQEVVKRIAEERGVAVPDIEWRETPSAQRETLISNGTVAMITATYSINKGRLSDTR